MNDRDDFLAWLRGELHDAEFRLHNGDPASRRAVWSSNDPVSVFGALQNAFGQAEIDRLFTFLGESFSNCTSFEYDVLAFDVIGDMAYTVCLEHTSVSINGERRAYTLRVTQVYRREDGAWRVVHRHGDMGPRDKI